VLWLLDVLIVVGSLGEWIPCFCKIDSNTKQIFFGIRVNKNIQIVKTFLNLQNQSKLTTFESILANLSEIWHKEQLKIHKNAPQLTKILK